MTKHIVEVRLNKSHIDNFLKNKTFTLKPEHVQDANNQDARIEFKLKKHLTRLINNIGKGTGTRIAPDDVHDIHVHKGNGFFDSLKKVISNPVVKSIIQAATPAVADFAGKQITNLTGNDAAGNIASNLLKQGSNELTKGSGLLSNIGHSIGLGITPKKSRVTKKLGGSFSTLGQGLGQSNAACVKLDKLNSGIGITATGAAFSDPTPMQQKMATLRSMRGKKNL